MVVIRKPNKGPYTILSKPLAPFLQVREKKLAESEIEPTRSCSQVLYVTESATEGTGEGEGGTSRLAFEGGGGVKGRIGQASDFRHQLFSTQQI